MSLTDLLTAAMQHPEKETLAWMILHSLYQARIVNHANTGEHRNICPAVALQLHVSPQLQS
jgi:hypothetical protein